MAAAVEPQRLEKKVAQLTKVHIPSYPHDSLATTRVLCVPVPLCASNVCLPLPR